MSMFAKPTQRICIIEFEAAENLVDVSCVEKTVTSNDHLEPLWGNKKKRRAAIRSD